MRILEVFSHLRCRNRAVLAMFSCFSDTSLSLPSEMITAAFQPCPPTPSEYSRPYSPLHFQSRCVGAHTRSLSSAEHLQNGSPLIYKDFANLLHDTKRLTICFIQYTRMHREWLKTPWHQIVERRGVVFTVSVISSSLSSPWQHLHTFAAPVAIRCNVRWARTNCQTVAAPFVQSCIVNVPVSF